TQGTLAACLEMLDYDPDASFGEFDHAVAQAVLASPQTIRTSTFFGIVRDISPDELAIKRLQIFLNGPHGTEAERKGAETALAELRARLPQVPAGFKGIPQHELTLPTGDPSELLRLAGDKRKQPFDRFPFALAAARGLKEAGDKAGALAAYRRAYELLHGQFPVYSGVVGFGLGMGHPGVTGIPLEMSRPRSLRWEPVECAALRHMVHEIGQLDPEAKSPLRGGLQFRIVGLDLPPDLVITLALSLWDPNAESP